jgi:hypothetical protein
MKVVIGFTAIVVGCVLTLAPPSLAAIYNGNGHSGFGGPIGAGQLAITNDEETVTFVLTRGTGDLNDWLVLYLDSRIGGFANTVGFNDQADDGRRAVSGAGSGGAADVTFGFEADFAIAFNGVFGGFLFELQDGGTGSLIFVASLGGGGNVSDPTFTFPVNAEDIELRAGGSFTFVGTYLNSSNGYRSDEGFGAGLPVGNPGVPSSVTFTSGFTYFPETVPTESSTWGLLKNLFR